MFYNRENQKRKWWLKTGIYISSIYMIFTIGNKLYIDLVFKESFKKAGISYDRFTAQPTILNNILWYAVAETDKQYHLAFYSLLDKSSLSEKVISVDKNHDLIDMDNLNLKTLSWFSNGYFNLSKKGETDKYNYVDLRYPMLNPEDENSSVFNFTIFSKNNEWDILPFNGSAPKKEDLKLFIERIRGI